MSEGGCTKCFCPKWAEAFYSGGSGSRGRINRGRSRFYCQNCNGKHGIKDHTLGVRQASLEVKA